MQKTSLKSLTSSPLSQGFHFREKIVESEGSNLSVVQMSNIDKFARINVTRLARIDFVPKYEKHLLRHGDILFLGRGQRNMASLVVEDLLPAVAATYFTMIRVKRNEILPEYLTVYLNLNETQKRIRELARGTALAVIPMSELAKLEIDVPPLETQLVIVELDRLVKHAEEIEEKINLRRSLLIEKRIIKMLHGSNGG